MGGYSGSVAHNQQQPNSLVTTKKMSCCPHEFAHNLSAYSKTRYKCAQTRTSVVTISCRDGINHTRNKTRCHRSVIQTALQDWQDRESPWEWLKVLIVLTGVRVRFWRTFSVIIRLRVGNCKQKKHFKHRSWSKLSSKLRSQPAITERLLERMY